MLPRENHNGWKVIINLASQPRRNVRFFRFLSGAGACLVGILLILLIVLNVKNFSLYRAGAGSYHHLADEKAAISSEYNELNRQTENFKRTLKTAVDEVNSLLARKSFSWTIFFDELEEALPAGAYLTNLNPSRNEAGLAFRIKAGLPSRSDLGQLIRNLDSHGFSKIRVLSESLQDGQFQVEMDFQHAPTE
ncbi:MAG TPA: hypothetical protein P5517_04065 [Candidatus Saccharicenans sp.]|nr:hypothetical protein [Candidatus Saccharicenans sp.]HQH61929.1 hypothetical protein [Candidatus Saccharicenans sp.]HRT25931.1 hypothetical protein [Candidatus Saccharicenans sp.]HRV06051.1 hypothetical protein [Candidatus Saccharicenans sp.]